MYWKCRTVGCKFSGITKDDNLINVKENHGHVDDRKEIAKKPRQSKRNRLK